MNEIARAKFRENVHLITRKAIALARTYKPQTEAEWKFFLLDLSTKIPELEVRFSHGRLGARIVYPKDVIETMNSSFWGTPSKKLSDNRLEDFETIMNSLFKGVDESIEQLRREEYIKRVEQLLKDEHLDDRYTIERFGMDTWAICSIENIQGMKTMAGIPENFEAAKALVQAIKEKEEHRGEA